MARSFALEQAVRKAVPVMVGLSGPSGCGKTFSALRLAAGIQSVTGGKIAMIDTEGSRGLAYADAFDFFHLDFKPPFGSLDYLAAIEVCRQQDAAVIVVDSMSHEHEGAGGLLDFHESELDRLAGSDYAKRERMKALAWQMPKAARRKLLTHMVQVRTHFIFCFRAKQTIKPVKVTKDGKARTEFQQQGFIPICGDEFAFEMTVNILLPPASEGTPQWISEYAGERLMMKLPMQFKKLFAETRQLDEGIGAALARWAQGEGAEAKPSTQNADPAPQPMEPTQDADVETLLDGIKRAFQDAGLSGGSEQEQAERKACLKDAFGADRWDQVTRLQPELLEAGLAKLREILKV